MIYKTAGNDVHTGQHSGEIFKNVCCIVNAELIPHEFLILIVEFIASFVQFVEHAYQRNKHRRGNNACGSLSDRVLVLCRLCLKSFILRIRGKSFAVIVMLTLCLNQQVCRLHDIGMEHCECAADCSLVSEQSAAVHDIVHGLRIAYRCVVSLCDGFIERALPCVDLLLCSDFKVGILVPYGSLGPCPYRSCDHCVGMDHQPSAEKFLRDFVVLDQLLDSALTVDQTGHFGRSITAHTDVIFAGVFTDKLRIDLCKSTLHILEAQLRRGKVPRAEHFQRYGRVKAEYRADICRLYLVYGFLDVAFVGEMGILQLSDEIFNIFKVSFAPLLLDHAAHFFAVLRPVEYAIHIVQRNRHADKARRLRHMLVKGVHCGDIDCRCPGALNTGFHMSDALGRAVYYRGRERVVCVLREYRRIVSRHRTVEAVQLV